MKTRFNLLVFLVLLGAMFLGACGSAAAPATEANNYAESGMPGVEMPLPTAGAPASADSVSQEAPAEASPLYNTGGDNESTNASFAASHMIIKNGEIKLLVEDTDTAVDRATQVIGDLGGYIVSSRVWYQPYADGENYKYATITIGIPVDQFERALSRLRGLAVKVLDETASGEDVTNQFVDLQSQLTNLEATRDRIKSFLDQAQTVDEALRINNELATVEGQIEQIKGQMNYLQDRSAYSTITVNFEPVLPELVSTPTPTPIPDVWNPGDTFNNAKKSVTAAYQDIVDLMIWFFVVLVPIFAPPVLLLWLLWKFFTRKSKKPSQ